MSNNLLKGKRGIIFGALDSNSIAWITAERVFEEGGTFVLTNAPVAMRMGQINELAEKTNSTVIPADATSLEDLENLIKWKIVEGGMIPKIANCVDAVENGVRGVVILDGRKPHSILHEIFSDTGSGTLIRDCLLYTSDAADE
mgnify:CR=1 FL=1